MSDIVVEYLPDVLAAVDEGHRISSVSLTCSLPVVQAVQLILIVQQDSKGWQGSDDEHSGDVTCCN